MGAYLDTPIKDKNSENGHNAMCKWGLCSMQGWRIGQEDDHLAKEVIQPDGKRAMLFCVWDGHGGIEVAEFAKKNFFRIFSESEEFKRGDI